MKYELSILPEPELEFGNNQKMRDPHDGLTLFGPSDLKKSQSKPKSISYAVVGTEEGISSFEKMISALQKPIFPEEKLNKEIWPPFPGFETVFSTELPLEPIWKHFLNKEDLVKTSLQNDKHKRAFEVVTKYLDKISLSSTKRDEKIDVIICIVPDEIYKNCKPESRVIDGWGDKPSSKELKNYKKGQFSLFSNNQNIGIYNFSVDFRRQLKARAMKHKIPIQIIRESTLSLEKDENDFKKRKLTTLSDRAWNLSTTLYYKAGGRPWKLSTARDGVCYIGVAFKKKDNSSSSKMATCAAQMFLNSGEGVIFLGDEGPWYSQVRGQFHLTKDAAKGLLQGILKSYSMLEGKELKEIFVHSRSEVNKEEMEGYMEACPKGVKLVVIRVRIERDGLKLFRNGTRPVMRGTFLKVNEKSGFLWGSGFKPCLGVYDGWEIPVPLKINILQGSSQIEQVAKDILGLTKLNYNTCKLGDSEPVTIKFSDAVGEILVSNPNVKEIMPQFKYYI